MRTERPEQNSRQKPVVYTTLEQALQAKLVNTKRVMGKLTSAARERLTNETKGDQKELPSV